jgi:hypothetical protein
VTNAQSKPREKSQGYSLKEDYNLTGGAMANLFWKIPE